MLLILILSFELLEENKLAFSELIQEHIDSQEPKEKQQQGGEQVEQEEEQQQSRKNTEDLANLEGSPKKQSEDMTAEIDKEELMEKRRKKRQTRKKQQAPKQIPEAVLQAIKVKELLEKSKKPVPLKLRKQICVIICKRVMQEEIKAQIQAMREGFFEILNKEYFHYQDNRDLQKLIIGIPSIDGTRLPSYPSSRRPPEQHRLRQLHQR